MPTKTLDRPTSQRSRRALVGVPEIRSFFRTNKQPVYFISATAFNLLGLDRWMRNFYYVNYCDSFEGEHPHVFVPRARATREFTGMEDVCNYLLQDQEVGQWLRMRGKAGKAAFVMFDEETEKLAAEAGLQVAHPPAVLRHRIDSKIVTTQLGNDAGVPSVPNALGHAQSYEELLALASSAGLGEDLVVQTPYGDSGKTTFFIHGRADWDHHAEKLVGQELKAMKRINCHAAAIEAVLTRHGTLVGPLMTDLTGYAELTPYAGGWCGNDIFPTALSARHRSKAREYTQKLGARLAQEGYKGFFEVDYLADVDSGELYLGELNPRISGVTSMTHVSAGAYSELPLFLFHLLEYMDVDYEIDVAQINRGWSRASSVDSWSQVLIKDTDSDVKPITRAPRTGVWRMDGDGHPEFARRANDWHDLADENEAYYLRVAVPGDFSYRGADLGILVARGRFQSADLQLTERCRRWVAGIKAQFAYGPYPTQWALGSGTPSVALKSSTGESR